MHRSLSLVRYDDTLKEERNHQTYNSHDHPEDEGILHSMSEGSADVQRISRVSDGLHVALEPEVMMLTASAVPIAPATC